MENEVFYSIFQHSLVWWPISQSLFFFFLKLVEEKKYFYSFDHGSNACIRVDIIEDIQDREVKIS